MRVVGLLAEFKGTEELIAAARELRADGYSQMQAYTPFPVEGLTQALGGYRDRIAGITLVGGIFGAVGGYVLQWYSATIAYPLQVGGRPLHSWPSFIPITFELAILGAATFAVLGMLFLNGLPTLHHPLFDVRGFDCASRDHFFLYIPRKGAPHSKHEARRRLRRLEPLSIKAVRA